jgi:acyl-CoA synthetase (AMP-forming)/AMP-acid ligase II
MELNTDSTLVNCFEQVVKECGADSAFQGPDGQFTYSALDEMSNAVAAELGAQGARSGDRVILLLHQGIDFIASVLGCLKAGCCAIPLDNSAPEQRLQALFAATNPHSIMASNCRDFANFQLGELPGALIFVENIDPKREMSFYAPEISSRHPAIVIFNLRFDGKAERRGYSPRYDYPSGAAVSRPV